ncbi:hypothetical protein HD806DRAFT_523772 [Xylariaceae sp. AK1471]|nr:hypothetical protein HD806DRAFT_523772 [Xylariaceae sp. AK1471]
MTDYTSSAGLPPLYIFESLQCSSGPTITEPTGLSPWQKRWNMEWLNEAYIPYMRYNDLLMERFWNRDTAYYLRKKTRPATEQFMLDAIEAGIASPKSALTRTRWPCGTGFFTWPVRMLASNTKRLWGRWRKHRENAKTWQMVAKGEMKLTFRDGVLHDYFNSPNPPTWIDFPSARDIKWYWVRSSCGVEWLQGGQDARSWAPDLAPESCIPFVIADGHVVRDCKPHNAHELADGNVFDNFVRLCPHCGFTTEHLALKVADILKRYPECEDPAKSTFAFADGDNGQQNLFSLISTSPARIGRLSQIMSFSMRIPGMAPKCFIENVSWSMNSNEATKGCPKVAVDVGGSRDTLCEACTYAVFDGVLTLPGYDSTLTPGISVLRKYLGIEKAVVLDLPEVVAKAESSTSDELIADLNSRRTASLRSKSSRKLMCMSSAASFTISPIRTLFKSPEMRFLP